MTEDTRKIRWGILATGGIAATFTEALLSLPDDAEVVAVGSRTEEGAKDVRRAVRHPAGVRQLGRTGGGRRRRRGVRRHAALRAPRGGRAVPGGRKGGAVREGVHHQLPRGAGAGGAGARTRALPDGGHVDVLQPADPQHDRARRRRRDRRGPARQPRTSASTTTSRPSTACATPELGGGAVLDLGVYPVSFAQMLLGEPDAVQAWAQLTPERVDANTGIVLGWNSGAVATLSLRLHRGHRGARERRRHRRADRDPRRLLQRRPLHRAPAGRGAADRPARRRPRRPRPAAACGTRPARSCGRCGPATRESPLVPLDGSLSVMRTLDTIRERIGVTYPGVD